MNRWYTVLIASFVVGLSFAWKKVPIDTMVQEAVPDGLRVACSPSTTWSTTSRGSWRPCWQWCCSPAWANAPAPPQLAGVAFLLWVPVLPRWLRNVPEIVVRVDADGEPEQVQWGGVSEPVTVLEAQGPGRWRVRLADGTILAIGALDDGRWEIREELTDSSP